jgi:hypothetical protein
VATLPSGLPDVVDDDEDLTRFLTSSGSFNSQSVKPLAFFPDRGGEASVFRHGAEPRQGLWDIYEAHVGGERTLYGAAILKGRHVRSATLRVDAAEPPPRHAVIVGWTSADQDPRLAKALMKEQAADLARHAELVRYP